MKQPTIIAIAAAVMASTPALAQIHYPPTPKVNVTDEYFGVKVADPYRWLEDDTSKQTAEWVKAENDVTRKYLNSIPMRADILKPVSYTHLTLPTKA